MRVLILPASRHGSTAEIGRAIARSIRDEGIDVDVSQPEHIFDLEPYVGYVVGSALYLGTWLDSALEFVDEHAATLRRQPTWLFSSGPLGAARPQEPIHPELVEHLMATTGARDHRLFDGRLDIERLSRTERFVARWVGAEDGDYRNWDEIDQWSRDIAKAIAALE
jgi:menaquinone-dependent protoporphyrinogen oxidase